MLPWNPEGVLSRMEVRLESDSGSGGVVTGTAEMGGKWVTKTGGQDESLL